MGDKSSTGASTGIGIGAAIAICVSWSQWHSLTWAIIHGMLGWIYVFYFALKDGRL